MVSQSQTRTNNPGLQTIAASNVRSPGFVDRVKDMVHMAFGRGKKLDPLFEQWDQYRYLPPDQRLATPMDMMTEEASPDDDSGQPGIHNTLDGVLDYASHKVYRDYIRNPVASNDDVIHTARALAYMERSQGGGLAFNV